MGWTFTNRPKGTSDRDWFTAELGEGLDILATHSTFRVFYAAVRNANTDQVFALVALKQWNRDDYYNFGTKVMDETVGPCEAEAPAKILDLLTPTDSDWANEWRQKCWDNLAAKKAADKVTPGTVVTFDSPLNFGRWGQFDQFRFVKRTTFETLDGLRVRIPGWKGRNFTVTA